MIRYTKEKHHLAEIDREREREREKKKKKEREILWILLCGSNGHSHVSSGSENPRTVCCHRVKVRDHWAELHLGIG